MVEYQYLYPVTLGMMSNINNTNVKRVNSLIYVSEGKLFKIFLNLSAYTCVNRIEDWQSSELT